MNRHERKRLTQKKLKKLYEQDVYFVTKKGTGDFKYYQRVYLSGIRKFAKRETNRKLRNSRNDFKLKGCAYRRKFDYWYTLF